MGRADRVAYAVAVLVGLTLAGCGGTDGDAPGAADGGADGGGEAEAEGGVVVEPRPETYADTVWIEGMPEPMTLRLFEAPESFPLEFSTYLPADMVAQTADEGPGGAVRFVAEFGGRRSPDAYLHVYVHPEGTPATKAQDEALAFRTSRGVPVSGGLMELPTEEPRFPWAFREYGFRYQEATGWYQGWLALGRHAGRIFQVVAHYPAEYGDGFGPRVERVLASWRWEDTGAPLGAEPSASAAVPPSQPARAAAGRRD